MHLHTFIPHEYTDNQVPGTPSTLGFVLACCWKGEIKQNTADRQQDAEYINAGPEPTS